MEWMAKRLVFISPIEQIPAVYFFLFSPSLFFSIFWHLWICQQRNSFWTQHVVKWRSSSKWHENQKYWLDNKYCLFQGLCSSLSVVAITGEPCSQRSKKCSKSVTDALLEGKPCSFFYSFHPNTGRFPRGKKAALKFFPLLSLLFYYLMGFFFKGS